MRELIRLIQCEHIKSFSWVKVIVSVILIGVVFVFLINTMEGRFYVDFNDSDTAQPVVWDDVVEVQNQITNFQQRVLEDPSLYHTVMLSSYEYILPYTERAIEVKNLTYVEANLRYLFYYYQYVQIIDFYLENVGNDVVSNLLQQLSPREIKKNPVYSYLELTANSSLSTIEERRVAFLDAIDSLEKAFLEDQYFYLAKQVYDMSVFLDISDDDGMNDCISYAVTHQITNANDRDYQNYCLFVTLQGKKRISTPLSREDFIATMYDSPFATYDEYYNYYLETVNETNDLIELSNFAYDHHLEHNLFIPNNLYAPLNSQFFMNCTLYLAFVILLIMSLFYSGIVSDEHQSGTVYFLYSKVPSRKKILLAKFLYLMIVYLSLWIFTSLFAFFLVGFRYGFETLLANRLVVLFGIKLSMPYLLWYGISVIICMIPSLLCLSILFFLSAIVKKKSLTASVLALISVLSFLVWFFASSLPISFGYIFVFPFMYVEYAFLYLHAESYLIALAKMPIFGNYALWSSLLGAILIILLTFYYYCKREVVRN